MVIECHCRNQNRTWVLQEGLHTVSLKLFPLSVKLSGYRNVVKTENNLVLNSYKVGSTSHMDMMRILSKHVKEQRKDLDKVNPSRKKVTRNGY